MASGTKNIENATPSPGEEGDVTQNYTSGAAHVTNLAGGVTHIREKLALDGTAVTFDWSATPIKAVRITVTADTAGTAELNDSIVVCIDPPNAAVRDAWLNEGTSLASDTQRIPIPVNTSVEINFTSAIDYLGLKRDDGTGTVRVHAVGVE